MVVIRLLTTISDELVDGKAGDGEAGYSSHSDHNCIHPVGVWNLLRFRELLIVRVPDAIHERFVDLNHKKEEEDDQHDQWTDHSPRDLPEDVGLMADHELDVLVEPAAEARVTGSS